MYIHISNLKYGQERRIPINTFQNETIEIKNDYD